MNKTTFAMIGCALLVLLAMLGCSNSTNPLAPFQPQISNSPDNFQFQATGLQNVNANVSYNWSNSGSQATVNHSSTVNSGTAMLFIYDANDSLVYSSALVASLNEPTQAGLTGTWKVRVTLTNCYGTLNFRAQKL